MSHNNNKDKNLHIAMYPWFAMGHLTSFLHLANKLAERGHRITFLLPTKTCLKLASHNHHSNLITFIPITIPPVSGLPVGAETTNDVPAAVRPKIMAAMDMTRDTIDSHLGHLRPDIIFFDTPDWLPGLARKHGVKSVYYATQYLVIFAYCSVQARNLPMDYCLTPADLMEPPPGFPSSIIRMHSYEARAMSHVFMSDFGHGLRFLERQNIAIKESDALGVKTCTEMEGAYFKFVQQHFGKPVFLAGPVLPDTPSPRLDDDNFEGWLNSFSHGSVVYCAFGSECFLEMAQFHELLLGLELTGRPFLAVLKPPIGCDTIELALPERFAERTKGKGIVHGGWVQQQLILRHPSVGCFVTHCGPGSLSEAIIISECQLVLIPQAVDQFVNARMMSLELRVGVEVEKREHDGFFTKEAVHKAVSLVMEEESEHGKEVRANRTKWKYILSREGLEESYISSFIQSMLELLG